MKYYTLLQASKKAHEYTEMFKRDNDPPFCRGLLNGIRMYFGLRPKAFYFDEKDRKKEPEHTRVTCSGYTDRGEKLEMKRVYEEDIEKHHLEQLLDEEDMPYRW